MTFKTKLKSYFSQSTINLLRSVIFSFLGNIKTIHLRFSRRSFFFIPHHHIKMMNILLGLIRLLNNLNIKYFLSSGTLLGSVRQGSFAGKPGDLDIAIKYKDLAKFKNYLKFNKKEIKITQGPQVKNKNLWMRIQGETIDIILLHEKKNFFVGCFYCYYKKKKINLKLSKKIFENIKFDCLYNIPVNVPKESLYLIRKLYGKKWNIADKKQYIWKDKYINHLTKS
jgi:phosphorylcholine metabolism protein LicD